METPFTNFATAFDGVSWIDSFPFLYLVLSDSDNGVFGWLYFLKVWSVRGTNLHLIHEVQEHSKGVTSLAVLEFEEKLYSGSLDKTIKVLTHQSFSLTCIKLHFKNHIFFMSRYGLSAVIQSSAYNFTT